MLVDKEFIRQFEVMEKLQDKRKIDYYTYNSDTGDFKIFTNRGEKNIDIWFDEETVLDIIDEIKKEAEKAEQEEKEEEAYREKVWWEKQRKIS